MRDEPEWQRRVIPIRGFFGVCHILVEADGRSAVLLDTGLVGEQWQIRDQLRRRGRGPGDVKAILLTHGHLDHVGNLAWAKTWTGAPIYAHPAEQAHIDGRYPYDGPAKWCGRLEAAGRLVLRVGEPAKIDVAISDGEELPFWGGLRVVHLPGHTLGHCGFYSERESVLFCGDLLACYRSVAGLPARMLNVAPELYPKSLDKAAGIAARFVVPNHYFEADYTGHRRRFERLMAARAARAGERSGPRGEGRGRVMI